MPTILQKTSNKDEKNAFQKPPTLEEEEEEEEEEVDESKKRKRLKIEGEEEVDESKKRKRLKKVGKANKVKRLDKQPSSLQRVTLRSYQLEGERTKSHL